MKHNDKMMLGNLIDSQTVAVVSSFNESGHPITEAMGPPRVRKGLRVLYFLVAADADKVAQFRADPRAVVYFYDRRHSRGVMLKGRMEVRTDTATKELAWDDGDAETYPDGPRDTGFCVLRFTAAGVRYFTENSGRDYAV